MTDETGKKKVEEEALEHRVGAHGASKKQQVAEDERRPKMSNDAAVTMDLRSGRAYFLF